MAASMARPRKKQLPLTVSRAARLVKGDDQEFRSLSRTHEAKAA